MVVLVFARLKPLRGGADYNLTHRLRGLWPGDKIFLLGREIKPVWVQPNWDEEACRGGTLSADDAEHADEETENGEEPLFCSATSA